MEINRINKTYNNISFQLKPGENILKHAKKEFAGDERRINRFVGLYCDTFSETLDEKTIIDLGDKFFYVLKNSIFPDVEYVSQVKLPVTNSIMESLLNECPVTLGKIELGLFRKIIIEKLNSGSSIEKLSESAEKIDTDESKNRFNKLLGLARRIVEEKPKQKISEDDFTQMAIRVEEENQAYYAKIRDELLRGNEWYKTHKK